MKRLKMIVVALVAVSAVGTVVASAAMAAAPEFNPSTKQGFKGTSGTTNLYGSGGQKITCPKDKFTGTILSATTISVSSLTYEECKYTNTKSESCEAKTPGKSAGLIDTSILLGKLGKVAKAEAASEVGELLAPETGSTFAEIEASCFGTGKIKVENSVIGEVTPVKKSQTTGEVIFKVGSTKTLQTIKKFEGGEENFLEAFGSTSGYEGTESITFEKAVEVT